MEELEFIYEETNRATRRRWAHHAGCGEVREPPFHPTRLSVTTGNFFEARPVISGLLTSLGRLVEDHPLADVMAPGHAHCTFLALSQTHYESTEALPDLTEVRALFDQHCRGQVFTLRSLRLVALPNALLLAGLPDAPTLGRRAVFAGDLLRSGWAGQLRARYPSGPIPPHFWHSTILRYQAEFLPERARNFFVKHEAVRYGDVTLEIRLLATDYRWNVARRLDL